MVIARVLLFDSAEAAVRYVSWAEANADLLVGNAEELEPLPLPGSPTLFGHAASGCCVKDLPLYLATWQRGVLVLSLFVSGPARGRPAVAPLAAELDIVGGRYPPGTGSA